MGWKSFDVVKFDLEPLLQGQTSTANLNIAYNLLIIKHFLCIGGNQAQPAQGFVFLITL